MTSVEILIESLYIWDLQLLLTITEKISWKHRFLYKMCTHSSKYKIKARQRSEILSLFYNSFNAGLLNYEQKRSPEVQSQLLIATKFDAVKPKQTETV